MTTQQKLKIALRNYKNSHKELNKAWQEFENDNEGGFFTRLYPFEKCFDALERDIVEWVDDATQTIDRIKEVTN